MKNTIALAMLMLALQAFAGNIINPPHDPERSVVVMDMVPGWNVDPEVASLSRIIREQIKEFGYFEQVQYEEMKGKGVLVPEAIRGERSTVESDNGPLMVTEKVIDPKELTKMAKMYDARYVLAGLTAKKSYMKGGQKCSATVFDIVIYDPKLSFPGYTTIVIIKYGDDLVSAEDIREQAKKCVLPLYQNVLGLNLEKLGEAVKK